MTVSLTKSPATVTESYLEGLPDGRALLRAWQAEGASELAGLARASLDTLNRTCPRFEAQSPVGQYLRGERDFWRNQVKKYA